MASASSSTSRPESTVIASLGPTCETEVSSRNISSSARREEPEEVERVLAHHGADAQPCTGCPTSGRRGEREQREDDPVADAVHVDDRVRRGSSPAPPRERGDHRAASGRCVGRRAGGPPAPPARPLRADFARAAARARRRRGRGSGGRWPPPARPRRRRGSEARRAAGGSVTIRATASLPSAPPAPTARFTRAGAYSWTGRARACAATSSATPRAWPSTSALRALRKVKTPSTATASGRYSASASAARRRSPPAAARAAPCASARMTPWPTWRQPAAAVLHHSVPEEAAPGVDA